MYVCVCNAVTERAVHAAIEAGATTVKHLKDELGVGAECGRCVGCAKACLKAAKVQSKTKTAFVGKLINISPVQLGTS